VIILGLDGFHADRRAHTSVPAFLRPSRPRAGRRLRYEFCWGPRASGNRSILCGPSRPDMKALLNAKGITPSVRAFGAELRTRMDVLVIGDTILLRQNER
jgi:hypothetical protein